MTRSIFLKNTPRIISCALSGLCFVVAQHPASKPDGDSPSQAQTSAKPKASGQSTKETLANPLNDLLDEAQRDIDQNQFEAAITPLQKVLADQPDFAYGHFQLAYVYTALKKSKEAQAEYERAIQCDPKMAQAYLNLGLSFLQSDPPGAEPQFARAVPPLRKAVELMPGQGEPLRVLAVAQ